MADAVLVTRRDVIREDIQRVRLRIERGGLSTGWWADHALRVASLDPETATREEVDIAAGNTSRASNMCDGCRRDVDVAVRVGDAPDYESQTATLCEGCVRAALALFAAADASPR